MSIVSFAVFIPKEAIDKLFLYFLFSFKLNISYIRDSLSLKNVIILLLHNMSLANFFTESFWASQFASLKFKFLTLTEDVEYSAPETGVKDYHLEIDMFESDWDKPSCRKNPVNWPVWLKIIFCLEIGFLSLSVYMGLAIYTPGSQQLMQEFQIGKTVATLPLSLFVIGYGIGPLGFSPITEHYPIGRTSVYIVTLFIFAILQIPTALSKDIASLCILRFLSGIFASPVLATGGASVCDIIQVEYMPVVLGIWAIFSLCGPSLGPLIGAFLVHFLGWRWTFWFMLILSSSSFIILGFFLPETYPQTLIYRKAVRLRRIAGDKSIKASFEDNLDGETKSGLLVKYLWRPIEVSFIEPVVFLINIYLALIYSVLYLWFEAFPIVYLELYDFSLINEGLCYCSILIGVIIGSVTYSLYIYYNFTLKIQSGNKVFPEVFLPMAIIGAICLPCGLFIFGWSSTKNVHWVVSLIGAVLAGFANFVVFQTLLNYLGMSFPKYVASVFAGNCLFRSVIAGVFPLFGDQLYNNLATSKFPVAWGSTVLGSIAALMILIPVIFYLNGEKLRARSKFTL